jgi:hypothetical protein
MTAGLNLLLSKHDVEGVGNDNLHLLIVIPDPLQSFGEDFGTG